MDNLIVIIWSLSFCLSPLLSAHGEPIDNVYVNDKYGNYRLRTEYCEEKSKCGLTKVQPNCNCDNLCRVFDDCCSNIDFTINNNTYHNITEPSIDQLFMKEQFECEHFFTTEGQTSALMVSYCPKLWLDNRTKQLCEDIYSKNYRDILLYVPVSISEPYIIFRNMYCAYCNNIFDFMFWKFENVCVGNSWNKTCTLFHFKPTTSSQFRNCGDNSEYFISSCSDYSASQSQFYDFCKSESLLIVFDEQERAYKNKFCAMCNGHAENALICDYDTEILVRNEYEIRVYSYRLIVDFNLHRIKTVNEFNGNKKEESFKTCVHDEIYDPISTTCRKLYCPPMLIASKGRCILKDNLLSSKDIKEDCPYIRLEQNEYKILNSTSLLLLPSNRTVDSSNFFINDSYVYMCSAQLQRKTLDENFTRITLDITESYLSLVGLICSIIALIITLSVYMMFSDLRNLPGKNLISLMVALLLAQVLFLSSSQMIYVKMACKVIAMSVHYFFLASFSWMNVISFDLFLTFSQLRGSLSTKSKVFYKYSLYGWLTPALIVLSAVVLEYSNGDGSIYKPQYGDTICLISSKNALLLFFLGPLAIFKFCDVIAFVCTSYHIFMSRRQSTIARRYTFCSFLIYLKLSFLMGLTWLFAFLALLLNNRAMWYLFIIFNTLQGVFIGLSFLFTKRTLNLIRTKINPRQNIQSTYRTNTTIRITSC